MRLHAVSARAGALGTALLLAATSQVPAPRAEPAVAPDTPRHYAAGTVTPHDAAPAAGDDVLALGHDGHERMTVAVEVSNAAGQSGPFAFLVDTGAERTVVARSVVHALGLTAGGRGRLVGMAGLREVDLVSIAMLNLGKRSLYDLASPVLEAEAIGADGIVGLDGLQGQRVLLDFDHNRMMLGDAASLGGDRGYDIVVQARRRSGQLIMTDALVDGVRTAVVIDTGSDTTIGNAALARALMRDRAAQAVQLLSVTGQQTTADLGLARKLTLGEMTLNNTVIAFADAPPFDRLGLRHRPAMLLGMAQLRLFHRVAIDFATRRILFAVPAAPQA